jgi:hypothetical protein
MSEITRSFAIPRREPIADAQGLVGRTWEWFFNSVFERLYPLGVERSFTLKNNQTSAADIEGLRFDKRGVSYASVDYLVHRVTSTSELVQYGTLMAAYYPDSEEWDMVQVSHTTPTKPNNAGITFSITADGQVRYATSDQSGAGVISVMHFRARTLAGKNKLYSALGAR